MFTLAYALVVVGKSDMVSGCTAARTGPDPCLPHGKTNILTGRCGDAGSQNPTGSNTTCYTCYLPDASGKCTIPISDCQVVEECGWPIMMSEIWGRYPCPNGEPVTTIPADFGLAYQFFESDSGSTLQPPLEATIRELHKTVGNAAPDGYHVLPGYGGTGTALSVLTAMAQRYGSSDHKLEVMAQAPYFFDYPDWPRIADETRLVWNPSADPSAATTIEIVNSPANPSGELRVPRVSNNSLIICDFVFDWPLYRMGAKQDLRCDVMIYSLSKLTGHAGSRFGWALVKDTALYEAAVNVMIDLTLGISVDAQVRANKLLRSIIDGGGTYFHDAGAVLSSRWTRLKNEISKCTGILSLSNTESEGPNAWLATPPGTNATATLLRVALLGVGGEFFGSDPRFVRFNLLDSNSTMELIFNRINELCARPILDVLVPATQGASQRRRYRRGRHQFV